MMRNLEIPIGLALLLAACGSPAPRHEKTPEQAPDVPVIADTEPAEATTPEAPPVSNSSGSESDANTQAPERESPKAVAARFGSLFEQHDFVAARAMIAEGIDARGASAEAFASRFADYKTVDAVVGDPPRIEGAAGSLYAEVPIRLSGTTRSGEPYSRTGTLTLRRVNDVPGSTEEQRRWHIVDFKLG